MKVYYWINFYRRGIEITVSTQTENHRLEGESIERTILVCDCLRGTGKLERLQEKNHPYNVDDYNLLLKYRMIDVV